MDCKSPCTVNGFMLSEELSSTQPLKYKPQQTKSGLGSFLFFCLYSCLLLSLFPHQGNRTGLFSTSWAPEVPFLPPPLLPVPKSLLPSPTICPSGPAGALLALGLAHPGRLPLTCAESPAPPQVLLLLPRNCSAPWPGEKATRRDGVLAHQPQGNH